MPARTTLTLGMLAAALAAAAPLAGCGFTPLYARPGVSQGLSAIEVVAPRGRVGYLLREDLDDEFGRDHDTAPVWRLEMELVQTRSPRGLTIADVAQRYQLGVRVRYNLTEIATGRIVHSGEVASQVSYDAADQPYAGIAARQDSQQRSAADAARRIRLDLSAWFNRRGAG
ncbi:MAG TPA: LPS assembly lipoprotein LptE [Caulobacteraceae bacterium]|nr:LPS assembly lipoprotein LptE [Caulobacteraceae bacterium]